ncbi:MAG: hypothetical protein ACI4WS_10150 [Oscillospiraceae bacterium]
MNIKETKEFQLAERFILRNARPLDMAVWRFRFCSGSREDVLTALAAFQNPDGGFGWGLEADCMNPNSSPVQTLTACGVLREIGFTDGSHPIVQGILRYLGSGADFDEQSGQWLTTVPTNNNFPHAIWWQHDPNLSPEQNPLPYNPTAGLAGFALRYAERGSALYQKAEQIAKSAIDFITSGNFPPEPHVTGSFEMLYHYLTEAGAEQFDLASLKAALLSRCEAELCREPSRWAVEYVPKPSNYIQNRDSLFYPGNEALCAEECALILRSQQPDGSFPVTWQWCTDYQEFALAANWWKARFVIVNMLFLAEFGG